MRPFLIFIFFGVAISRIEAQPVQIRWQHCYGGTLGESGYSVRTYGNGFIFGGDAGSNDGDVFGNHQVGLFDYWAVKTDSLGSLIWQRCYGGSDVDELRALETTHDGGFVEIGNSGSLDGDINGMHIPSDYWIVKCDTAGNIQWQKCLGGSDEDLAYNLLVDQQQNFLMIGRSQSSDFDVTGRHDTGYCPTCADAWIVKLDSAGSIKWAKCYGGYRAEIGYAIIQIKDSGYVFVASTRSVDGDVYGIHGPNQGSAWEDFWMVKIDTNGIVQWQKCLGGSDVDIPNDIKQTYDGGFILTGTTMSVDYDVTGHHGPPDNTDVWIVKTDSIGNLIWQKCLGGLSDDVGKKIVQLADSSYLVLAYTSSQDGDLQNNPPQWTDIWLIRLDKNGNLLWQECIGGSFDDAAYDILQLSNSEYVLTGLTESNDGDVSGNHGQFDAWVLRISIDATLSIPHNNLSVVNNITVSCFHNSLHIGIYSPVSDDLRLQLLDVQGQELYNNSFTIQEGFQNFEIGINNISSGFYFAKLQSKFGAVTKKILIQ